MALASSKSHVTASTVNQAVTKANKNKSTYQHKEAARLARKAAKVATEQGDYHLANHYHRIYEHHSQLANMRKSETKDNPTNMVKISDEEHAKGTPYYNKPTEKSETRLAILAKGIQAAVTLRGLVKAEKEIKSSDGGNK